MGFDFKLLLQQLYEKGVISSWELQDMRDNTPTVGQLMVLVSKVHDVTLALEENLGRYKRVAECTYQHNFSMAGNGFCSKCGWRQPKLKV